MLPFGNKMHWSEFDVLQCRHQAVTRRTSRPTRCCCKKLPFGN